MPLSGCKCYLFSGGTRFKFLSEIFHFSVCFFFTGFFVIFKHGLIIANHHWGQFFFHKNPRSPMRFLVGRQLSLLLTQTCIKVYVHWLVIFGSFGTVRERLFAFKCASTRLSACAHTQVCIINTDVRVLKDSYEKSLGFSFPRGSFVIVSDLLSSVYHLRKLREKAENVEDAFSCVNVLYVLNSLSC